MGRHILINKGEVIKKGDEMWFQGGWKTAEDFIDRENPLDLPVRRLNDKEKGE